MPGAHHAHSPLEATCSIGRAKAGGIIVARPGRTQVGAAATAVAAAGDVEEAAGVAVGVGAVGHAPRIAGQGVDTGDDGGGDTGAAEDQPPALQRRTCWFQGSDGHLLRVVRGRYLCRSASQRGKRRIERLVHHAFLFLS